MKRLLTAVVAVPLLVAALVLLPSRWILLLSVVVVELAAIEFVRLTRSAGADRVAALLLVLVPAVTFALTADLWGLETGFVRHPQALLVAAFLGSGFMAVAGLASRGDFRSTLGSIGALSFGLPYFSLAAVSYVRLHEMGPWLIMLLLIIVWGGDSAAFYVGSRWGRRKLAPVVSPNKTWLGAIASFVTAILGAALWCQLKLGAVDPAILLAAAVAAVVAQFGDLIESLFKRAVGVKDSGDLLPGHGGMLDRMDAILLAGPAFYLMLLAVGAGS